MRLKSLEIKGFKSFADKTVIQLDHPITGIVGPNGCGKSNIVDAIRWVIGEHKIKSLRSDNLDDLVFNGSRSRSASGMAEVSLTFENTRNLLPTEFTTVTITRKFYKSGESEYRLNDVTCRLKDIHNLFLDTGVSNDSYAIIELGMVDDIIKDKDGSRRRMLEQAAGISIYKTRKKEAKLKLDATEQDLNRIEDLLFEIGNNLRTLENQAKKAERYFQIKSEYKTVSVELAKASLEDFNEQYKTLNEQVTTETDRKIQLEAQVATEEASVTKDKVVLIEREQELNGLQKHFNELISKISQLESDKKLAAQRLDYLKEREKSLAQFVEGAGQQLTQLQESIDFATSQIGDETAALATIQDELKELRAAVDVARADFDAKKTVVEKLRIGLQDQQRLQFDAEKKVAVADSSVMNLQRSMQQIVDEKTTREAQIKQLQDEKADHAVQIQEQQDRLQDLIAQQEEVKGKIFKAQEQLEQHRSNLVEENRKLDAKRNEHDLLKSLVDSLEGYPDSIKFLKKNAAWKSDAPLLSDVCAVQKEYRTALENVLDSYLNYYVVENWQEALEAIQLLDTNKKGKANFFVLNQVAQHATAAPKFSHPQVTPALTTITVDAKYQALANQLLQHVFIADDLNALQDVVLEKGMVLIDKKGNLMKGAYAVGGGSVGLFEGNKIGRAKNLERLTEEIAQLTTTTQSLQNYIEETQTLITGFNQALNGQAIEQTKTSLNQLQNQEINLGNRIENFEHLNKQAVLRVADLQAQLDETQDSISDTREALATINEAYAAMQKDIAIADAAFKEVEVAFNAANEKYNHHNLAFTRQQSKLDNLQQELAFRTNQLADLRIQIEKNNEQLAETHIQITATTATLQEGDAAWVALLKQKEVDEKVLNEKDRLYYEFRNTLSEQEGLLNQKRREKEQAEQLLTGIKDTLNELKLRLTGMKERLLLEFKVNIDDIIDEARTGTQSVEELNAEAEKMKKRLDNIGEVNPTAIEAFQEIKARHDFIVEQKMDLVDAKVSLMSTIEEVETTANEKFKETFDKVSANFKEVFKALFTAEDSCDLRLTDPNNVAESGIEIYAQPKGKRPSTLTQLSGGEKTLTSTAFLFAIYLIKPAPFCILDEVDAPLDDANVGKFTHMIRQFSDNSQFIIVTHNKQTMSAVDVIYGVTMQEAGVSKLVPVDFRSLND